jgi:signal transduction histidine kinase
VTTKDSRWAVRATQIGFLVLLLACSAQLAYWMADESRYTAAVRDELRAALENQPGTSPAELAQLDTDRFHRMNRYAWEGGFFLIVLVGAMGVVYAALREENALRRQQEDFLASASHELKSPLASLRLSAETIALRDPAPPRRAELVQRLLSDLGRLDQMIANMLDASRLSRPGVRVSPERMELAPLVSAVAHELRPLADDCGVTVLVEVHDGVAVHADRDGVRTIALNLIHNGIKAARSNGGTVTVSGVRDAHGVTLHIDDTGIGFESGESRRLFQKFYRIEAGSQERPGGTGLGLYLVRRCAEVDGATVSATSDGPGRGARFTVRWPLPEPATFANAS